MDTLLERLEEHEAAARGQVERLRAQITALSTRLAAQDDGTSRPRRTRPGRPPRSKARTGTVVMDAYEMQHAADAFAPARAKFDALVEELGSAGVAGLTHAQLEDLLAERQLEVTRQLLQDLLDA